MYDLIIIGAGPAGLSAALYAKRAGMEALTIEQSPVEGGQILTTDVVDNYLGIPEIGGFELGMKFREHALKAGACLQKGTVNKVERTPDGWKLVCGDGSELQTRAVIFATGAEHIPLDVPGELTYRGKGVSYCATCDGGFFKSKDVAVLGGGNTAVSDAVFLSDLCRKVTVIHRRGEFRADKIAVDALKAKDNITLMLNSSVTSLNGTDRLESITVETGGEKRDIKVSGLFIAIGNTPQSDIFKDTVKTDEKGYIIAGEDCVTSSPGIFAAGDCRTKPLCQLVTAAADGAVAAVAACAYIDSLSFL